MTMSKLEKKIRNNAVIRSGKGTTGKGHAVKALSADDFDSRQVFADYREAVENFQRALWRQAGGSDAPVQVETANIYLNRICDALEFSKASKDKVLEAFGRGMLLSAHTDRDKMTAESAVILRDYNDRIKKLELKEVAPDKAEQLEKEIATLKAERDNWKAVSAEYETALTYQASFNAFRRRLELKLGYVLENIDIAGAWETSLQRADTKAWLRWIEKAQALNVDFEPYKKALDLEGLKQAVKTAYVTAEKKKTYKAVKSAKAEKAEPTEPAETPAE